MAHHLPLKRLLLCAAVAGAAVLLVAAWPRGASVDRGASAARAEPAPPHLHAHAIGLTPVGVEWVERALPDGRKELVLIVEKRVATDATLAYEVEVPEALRAQLGTAALTGELPPDFVGKREVKVALPTAPVDLRNVVARARLEGQGLHFNARVPARAEPSAALTPNFKREARTARFGGIDLGQPIILDVPQVSVAPPAGGLAPPELAPGALPR